MSYLIAGMFECHDKARFEITAISYGPADPTEMRARLQASNEHFIDAGADSDDWIDKLIRESKIDILIDLKGFTTNSRTSILVRRLAPIQVNYLGFPGTMGANYIDYIVANRIVIPENQRDCYAGKNRLSAQQLSSQRCQANDRRASIHAFRVGTAAGGLRVLLLQQ
jgi:protein O-GlcNAc transferase